jgi:hypothetical protein
MMNSSPYQDPNDECTDIRIFKTYNYDQFKIIEQNREVKGKTVANSIDIKNLLIDKEILVNDNMEVLDGQHRLDHARKQGLPLYYRFAQLTRLDDIGLIQNSTTWRAKQHVRFHCLQSKSDYLFIKEIEVAYKLKEHFIIYCCDSSHEAMRKLRSGTFSIKDDIEALRNNFRLFSEIKTRIEEIIKQEKCIYTVTLGFQRAMWVFMKREDYVHTTMLHAISKYRAKLLPLLNHSSEKCIYRGLQDEVFYWHRVNPHKPNVD